MVIKMNRKTFNKIGLFIISGVYCLFFVTLGEAAFKDSGWGTRPAGMGGAFVAIADDANAPLWNPAGIAQVKQYEASFMYARLFSGLKLYAGEDTTTLGLNYFSFICPTERMGAFGLSWARFASTKLYKEDTLSVSYARKINDFAPKMVPVVFLGMNLKYLNHGYTLDERTVDDPVFEDGDSAGACAVDLGVLVKPQKDSPVSLGLSLKNINQPDVGLDNSEYKLKDEVPLEMRAGIAYRGNACRIFNFLNIEGFIPAFDFTYRDKDINFHLGMETRFSSAFAFRIGYNLQEFTLGMGLNHLMGEVFAVQFDYALIWPLEIEETSGTHRVSLGIHF